MKKLKIICFYAKSQVPLICSTFVLFKVLMQVNYTVFIIFSSYLHAWFLVPSRGVSEQASPVLHDWYGPSPLRPSDRRHKSLTLTTYTLSFLLFRPAQTTADECEAVLRQTRTTRRRAGRDPCSENEGKPSPTDERPTSTPVELTPPYRGPSPGVWTEQSDLSETKPFVGTPGDRPVPRPSNPISSASPTEN